jgi:hypothetical protein
MVIELEPIDIAEVSRLAYAQDHRFEEPIEPPEHVVRRHLMEIPRPHRALDRLKRCILADALTATEHDGVIDLVSRALHAVRQPVKQVLNVVAKHAVHVVEPWPGLGGSAGDDRWCSIEVEAFNAAMLDPAAFGDQSAVNNHWQAGRPCHLLDRPVPIEPRAGGSGFWFAALIEYRLAVTVKQRLRRDAGIDTARGPQLPCRNKDI